MKHATNIALGNSDSITAGHSYEGVWLRIEGRGRGAIAIEMNEYQAQDIINRLTPLAKKRPQDK